MSSSKAKGADGTEADVDVEPQLDFGEEGDSGKSTKASKKEKEKEKKEQEKKDEKEKEQESKKKLNDVDAAIAQELKAESDRRNREKKVFKLIVKEVQVRKLAENCDPYVKFRLGPLPTKKKGTKHLDKTDDENREAFLQAKKKPAKKFRTRQFKNARRGSAVTYNKTFVKYWTGTYEELDEQYLKVELWDQNVIFRNEYLGDGKIKLTDLASGNIRQHMNMIPDVKRSKGKRRVVAGEVDFICYFQEVFDFKLNFYDWEGSNLPAADVFGTSDPYVVFSIPRSWSQPLTRGVSFGRSCKSPVIANTLFPKWEECGSLSYRGTRSELEDEDLIVKVYDWDMTSADDFLGESVVPLRGVLDYGYLKCGLLKKTKIKVAMQKKKVPWNVSAGSLVGYVKPEDLPMHQQFGDQVKLRPHHRYLAVHIASCAELRDCYMGYSDPFVVVEWDGMRQETKVIEKELNPYFDETLYFPVRMANVQDVEELRKKPRVRISVYNHGAAGNDFLGATELPLYGILLSKSEKTREFGGQQTRMFRGTMKLADLGALTQSTVSLRAYFIKDFPPEMVLEEDESQNFRGDLSAKDRDLPPLYLDREARWRNAIFRSGLRISDGEFPCKALDENRIYRFLPSFLTPIVPPRDLRNILALARMIQSITWAEDKDVYGAAMQRAKGSQQRPTTINNSGKGAPGAVATAGSVAASRAAVANAEGAVEEIDVWTSPSFFLSVRKGDSEDHAILMCNLLLGMGKDAYLCYGRSRSGIDSYVWVMVREGDGSVHFWETSTAVRYRLPDRWQGMGLSQEECEHVDVDLDDIIEYDRKTKDALKKYRSRQKRARGKRASSNAASSSAEDAPAEASELQQLEAEGVDDDDPVPEAGLDGDDVEEEEVPEADLRRASATEGDEAEAVDDVVEEEDEEDEKEKEKRRKEKEKKEKEKAKAKKKSKNKNKGEAHSGLAAFLHIDEHEPTIVTMKEISAIAPAPSRLTMRELFGEVRPAEFSSMFQSVLTLDGHVELPQQHLEALGRLGAVGKGMGRTKAVSPAYTPYATIEVVFNHENLWCNITGELDPGKTTFDFEDESTWLPFITEESRIPVPVPFYDSKPLGPKMAQARCRAVRNLIWNETKAGYVVWRHRANMETKFLNEYAGLLEEGLEIMERLKTTPKEIVAAVRRKTAQVAAALIRTEDEDDREAISLQLKCCRAQSDKYDLDYWRSKLMQKLPAGYEFEGVPISFAYTDHKKIRRFIMDKYDFHEDSDEKVAFALGVWVTPYANSVNSVWVFVAKLWPAVVSGPTSSSNAAGASADGASSTPAAAKGDKKPKPKA